MFATTEVIVNVLLILLILLVIGIGVHVWVVLRNILKIEEKPIQQVVIPRQEFQKGQTGVWPDKDIQKERA